MYRLVLGVAVLCLPQLALAQVCDRFGEAKVTGAFRSPEILESSGLAVSPFQPGVLFTHNDSGDTARVFAFAGDGEDLGEFSVVGASNIDWEDMALGPCKEGPACLFAGDIGDNGRGREVLGVYRFLEPQVGGPSEITSEANLELRYPDGARDAEALLVDPQTGDLFIFEKTQDLAARVVVLRDAGQIAAGAYALEAMGTIDFQGVITGGDFDPTGYEIILRGYGSEGLRMKAVRDGAGRVLRFIKIDTPDVGLLGEAVSYRSDGLALLSTIEGAGAVLYETPCLMPEGSTPGPAVGPLVAIVEPVESSGCGNGNRAGGPLLLMLSLVGWRRRR